MGIVTAGAGILLGGAVAYAVTNIDDLTTGFVEWVKTSDDVIRPFFDAIDTLGSKFVAMGGYLLGAGDDTNIYSTFVQTGTKIVDTLTTAFSGLLGMTADLIEGFAKALDFIDGIVHPQIGNSLQLGVAYDMLSDPKMQSEEDQAYWQSEIARLEGERSPSYSDRAAGVVATIRGAKETFDQTGKSGDPSSLEWMMYERLHPMGPAPPPTNNNKTPPKINFKQVNHNTWHVRDTDPNAIVAGFNKTNARKAAQPLRSALAMTRRI
jgi:hypothetical protein